MNQKEKEREQESVTNVRKIDFLGKMTRERKKRKKIEKIEFSQRKCSGKYPSRWIPSLL
jgi:hypothetical protein